jgi:undecaprenyl-diphosphatase
LEIFQSIFLGIVQGFTEFLPVSSSAHLSALPQILGIKSVFLNSLSFDIALHAGTLLAVVVFFWKKITGLFKGFFGGLLSKKLRKAPDFRLSINIIIATLPVIAAGVLLKDKAEGIFRNPVYTGSALLLFGILLWAADIAGKKRKDTDKISIIDSAVIGLAQVLSLVPGVSRSGITITAGLFAGLKRQDAAEFAFLLSIPAIAGAFVFKLKDIIHTGAGNNTLILAAGFIASAIAGFAAITFLISFVKKNSYFPFVLYRFALGAFIIGAAMKVF